MAGHGTIDQLEPGPRSKCRKWRVRVSTGLDPVTGKYGRATKTVHGTYREAQQALHELVVKDDEPKSSKAEFGELFDSFMASLRIKENTRQSYKSKGRKLLERFGNARMDRLSKEMFQAYIDELSESYAPKYVKEIRDLLVGFLKWCERASVIASAARLAPEPVKCPRTTRKALTDDSVASLIGSCRPEVPAHRAVMLALCAGLRRGEACRCLRWEDIDWQTNMVHVPGTKTKASDATVPMLPMLRDFLEPVKGTGYVVDLSPETVSYHWERMRKEVGLDGVCFHELRHSFITMLARADVHPSVMQTLARHSSMQVTMEVYTHVHKEQEIAALDAFQQRVQNSVQRILTEPQKSNPDGI